MAQRPLSLPHKRGSTFAWAGTANLPAGTWACSSHVEDASGGLIENLTVTLLAPVSPATLHTLALEASAEATADWPVGAARCDLRFEDDSDPPVVLFSPTFYIRVEPEVTE